MPWRQGAFADGVARLLLRLRAGEQGRAAAAAVAANASRWISAAIGGSRRVLRCNLSCPHAARRALIEAAPLCAFQLRRQRAGRSRDEMHFTSACENAARRRRAQIAAISPAPTGVPGAAAGAGGAAPLAGAADAGGAPVRWRRPSERGLGLRRLRQRQRIVGVRIEVGDDVGPLMLVGRCRRRSSVCPGRRRADWSARCSAHRRSRCRPWPSSAAE